MKLSDSYCKPVCHLLKQFSAQKVLQCCHGNPIVSKYLAQNQRWPVSWKSGKSHSVPLTRPLNSMQNSKKVFFRLPDDVKLV